MSSVSVIIDSHYCIISSFEEDTSDFVTKVNELLQEGWELNGGLSSSNSKIFQALTRLSK